jgi:hypothetical protein
MTDHPQHAAINDNLMDDVSKLLHSTPLDGSFFFNTS